MKIKKLISFFLFLLSLNLNAQKDTLAIYYEIGEHKLTQNNLKAIQTKLNKLNNDNLYEVKIISSCDFLGSNKSNLELSLKRAITVKNLLIQKENLLITSVTHKGIGELQSAYKSKKGNLFHRKTILIFKDQTTAVLEKIIHSEIGKTFILKDINFEPGRHYLKKESLAILNRLITVLQKNPKLEIELSGHVCCGKNKEDKIDAYDKDSKTYNLSENRAKHIFKYLTHKNIDTTRLSYKGYGFQKPLKYPETSLADKKVNRRVEIKITKN